VTTLAAAACTISSSIGCYFHFKAKERIEEYKKLIKFHFHSKPTNNTQPIYKTTSKRSSPNKEKSAMSQIERPHSVPNLSHEKNESTKYGSLFCNDKDIEKFDKDIEKIQKTPNKKGPKTPNP
jgi:hypothetical protein